MLHYCLISMGKILDDFMQKYLIKMKKELGILKVSWFLYSYTVLEYVLKLDSSFLYVYQCWF